MNGINFLKSAIQQFKDYKALGDRTMEQLQDADLQFAPNDFANTIATYITHLHGNMLSRWTNFLTEDGEKVWRERDAEFSKKELSRNELSQLWEAGWNKLFDTLQSLTKDDLDKIVFIRTKPLTVIEAIHRQLTHYAYHVGQIVYIGIAIKGSDWQSLSIVKGASQDYNEQLKAVL